MKNIYFIENVNGDPNKKPGHGVKDAIARPNGPGAIGDGVHKHHPDVGQINNQSPSRGRSSSSGSGHSDKSHSGGKNKHKKHGKDKKHKHQDGKKHKHQDGKKHKHGNKSNN